MYWWPKEKDEYSQWDFLRAFKAANTALFTINNTASLIAVAQAYATRMSALDNGWHYITEGDKYVSLINSVKECCDDVVVALVVSEGEYALVNKPSGGHNRRYDRERISRGRKRQAYRLRVDEADEWHQSHRCSKSWKDQSRRKHQWK